MAAFASPTENVLQLDAHASLRRVEDERIQFLNLDRCLRQPHVIDTLTAPENIGGVSLVGNYLLRMPTFVGHFTNLIDLDASHNELNDADFLVHRAELSAKLPACTLVHPCLRNINLSYNHIKTLPSNIHHLRFVHTLDLSHNHLSNLPDNFGCLEQLRTLNLNHNRLTALPRTFTRLAHLEFLDLSKNDLQSIDTLKNITNLKYFHIGSNPLKTFPLLLYSCVNIEHLSVSNIGLNDNDEIAFDYFARFPRLKKLDLSNNALTDHFVQAPATPFSTLEELYLQTNRLTDISSLLSSMPSLCILDMSSNALTSIPRGLHDQLKVLRLANNQIDLSPNDCTHLKDLIELDLARNDIHDLPPEFLHCLHLQTLNLAFNPLGKIPTILFELRGLNSLTISDANLHGLPAVHYFDKYFSRTLNHLDLSNNRLHSNLQQLTVLRALTHLDLSGNQLNELDREFRTLTCLKVLKLGRNRFGRFPSFLYEMATSGNQSLIGETLLELYINDNQLETIPDNVMHMTGIQTIDLSNNRLARFPEPVLFLDQLQTLIYTQEHGTAIETLPDEFVQLCNLRELDLSHNIFYEIPTCVYGLTKLESLDMSHNLLTAVENNRLRELKHLKAIKLNGNAFPSFSSAVYQVESSRLDDNPSCAAPPNDLLAETHALAVSNLFVHIHEQYDEQLFQNYKKILIEQLPSYDIERLLIRLRLPDKDIDEFRKNCSQQTKREEKVESLLNMWKQKRDSLANAESLYKVVQLIGDKKLSQNVRKANLLARKIRI